nr:hypothetical protein [Shigella boydii]
MNPEPSLNPICRVREIGIALSYKINLKNVKFYDKKITFILKLPSPLAPQHFRVPPSPHTNLKNQTTSGKIPAKADVKNTFKG